MFRKMPRNMTDFSIMRKVRFFHFVFFDNRNEKNGSSSVCEKRKIAGTPVPSSQNPA